MQEQRQRHNVSWLTDGTEEKEEDKNTFKQYSSYEYQFYDPKTINKTTENFIYSNDMNSIKTDQDTKQYLYKKEHMESDISKDLSTSSTWLKQQESDISSFHPSHSVSIRSSNRLDARLEDLHRDVANLSLKLRSKPTNVSIKSVKTPERLISKEKKIGNKSDMVISSAYTAIERVKNTKSTSKPTSIRHLNPSKSPKTSREMRAILIERNHLRMEIDQLRRELTTMTRKYQEILKEQVAHEKLKQKYIALQETLETSEKIRLRQKKLLQRVQQQTKDNALSKGIPMDSIAGKTVQNAYERIKKPRTLNMEEKSKVLKEQEIDRRNLLTKRKHTMHNSITQDKSSYGNQEYKVDDTYADRVDILDTLLQPSRIKTEKYTADSNDLLRNNRSVHRNDTLKRTRITEDNQSHSTQNQKINFNQYLQNPLQSTRSNYQMSSNHSTQSIQKNINRSKTQRRHMKSPIRHSRRFLAPTQASMSWAVPRRPTDHRLPFRA